MKHKSKIIICQRPTGYPVNLISGNITPGIEPPFNNFYIRKIRNEKTNKEGSSESENSNRDNP